MTCTSDRWYFKKQENLPLSLQILLLVLCYLTWSQVCACLCMCVGVCMCIQKECFQALLPPRPCYLHCPDVPVWGGASGAQRSHGCCVPFGHVCGGPSVSDLGIGQHFGWVFPMLYYQSSFSIDRCYIMLILILTPASALMMVRLSSESTYCEGWALWHETCIILHYSDVTYSHSLHIMLGTNSQLLPLIQVA